MTPNQASLMHDYLARQRWYAGKGRDCRIERIEALSWLSPSGSWPAVRVELVTVRYLDGDAVPVDGTQTDAGEYDVYQIPVSYRDEPVDQLCHAQIGSWDHDQLGAFVYAYDALFDKQATPYWLDGLVDEREAADLTFHRVEAPTDLGPRDHSLVLSVEQTNTSLVFGESALLKVFRRVHHGANPDIEVHDVLTRNECTKVAKLFGSMAGRWTAADGTVGQGDLAMFSDFFRTATDGWEQALTSVRDLYAEGDLHADEVGGDFAGEAHRLGATTARIHADLARLLPTASLSPEALAVLAAGMRERLGHAVQQIPALAAHAEGLRAAYDALAHYPGTIAIQRIHGDLHLGQTMRTVGGWRLIDFEGEPARPFAERGTLDSPLRDVAGMLRSFDYAAQALLAGQVDTSQLTYRAREWAERNQAAFCAGYGEVADADPRADEVLLRAYETDKAVYEVMYEARNRPDWLAIPLAATERLAAAAAR